MIAIRVETEAWYVLGVVGSKYIVVLSILTNWYSHILKCCNKRIC